MTKTDRLWKLCICDNTVALYYEKMVNMMLSKNNVLNCLKIEALNEKNYKDYLGFFDKLILQSDNRIICYCTMWNMTEEEIETEIFKPVKQSRMCLNESSRKATEGLLAKNAIHGYLAYLNDLPVGWCNAGDRNGYVFLGRHVKNDFSMPNGKILSIVGIEVEESFRSKGIADSIVKHVCCEAKKAGYEYVEAYPSSRGCMSGQTYRYLTKLYEKNGFISKFVSESDRIMQKDLSK